MRFAIAYTLGLNAGALIFWLSMVIGSTIHHENLAALFGGLVGIAVGLAAGLRIARAMKRLAG
jgi:hypothetical protein